VKVNRKNLFKMLSEVLDDAGVIEEEKKESTKTTLNRASLYETIAEVMSETEENFGEMPSGGLLHEAWDSGWPKHFEELRSHIADQTTKGKIAENILFKYSMDSLIFRFLNAENIWEKYTTVFKNLTSFYFQTANERPEDFTKARGFVNKVLNLKEKKGWIDKIKDAQMNKGAMGKLRAMNKMISSLDKQLGKFWKSIDTEGMDQDPAEHVDHIITQQIQSLQFQEANLMTSRILNIIQFVDEDGYSTRSEGSDANAKKLTAFRKKVEKEAADDNININIIGATNEWIEDELLNIDMTPCDDASAEWDEPCVFHQFDDGFFWYDVRSDNCDLSARHLNNCGQASMGGSELFNLMSYSEAGKPRWHVMIEWNQGVNAIIQVLGNSNQVPKEEYWPYIKWFYEKMGKPEISNYAWEHVQGGDVKRKVYNFLMYLGLKSNKSLTATWSQMKQQITDGFYNVKSYEGDNIRTEGDFSRLTWIAQEDRISMSMRIKRKLLKVGSEAGHATYDDVRDYKNAARRLQRTEVLADDYVINMIPREWDEFFDASNSIQRVRFSHGGNMVLYFNWTTNALQNPSFNEEQLDHQRENLAAFMEAAKRNFSVEVMTQLGKDFGNQLAEVADEILMSRPAKDLDEESQRILNELLKFKKEPK